MSIWNKITLYKFQQVNAINDRKDMPELDKLLFSICAVFNMTEYQLDNAGVKKAAKLTKKIKAIFDAPFAPGAVTRIGRYVPNYDPASFTFGQYIELCFYLSETPVQNIHYVLASISRHLFRKHKADNHSKKARYFLHQPMETVMGSYNLLVERFKAFNKGYSSLFGLDAETHGNAQGDVFNKRYGWIYAASQVAEYERIPLDDAYGLPIRQALNDLAYLKAKSKYEIAQLKKT